MKDLYRRLREVGFDPAFLRRFILPDWWQDELAAVPANRALAEAAIFRALGFPLARLRDAASQLSLPATSDVRLKLDRDVSIADVQPGILLGEQLLRALVPVLRNVPSFAGTMGAAAVRAALIAESGAANLRSLIAFAWSRGVPVLHLRELPKGTRKLDGLALFSAKTPVILLASARTSPSWLAFHLAHELGHVMLGHVTANSQAIVDSEIYGRQDDGEEEEANHFACEVFTGIPEVTAHAQYGLTGRRLAAAVSKQATAWQADPGVIALMYGHHATRMGAAQAALNAMGLDTGAHKVIAEMLAPHLPPMDELPEVTERFLDLVTRT